MDSLVSWFSELPTIAKIVLGILGVSLVYSTVKKLVKVAVLVAILIMLMFVVLSAL